MSGPMTDYDALARLILRDTRAVASLGIPPCDPNTQARVIADCAKNFAAARTSRFPDLELRAWDNLTEALEGWR